MASSLGYLSAMKAPLFSTALALASVLAIAVQDSTPDADQPLAVGDAAPLFTLNDQKGQLASLGEELEGWTLIAFYPKALTGG